MTTPISIQTRRALLTFTLALAASLVAADSARADRMLIFVPAQNGNDTCQTTIDFEGLDEGQIVSETEGGNGVGPIGVHGDNPRLGDRNAAVVYDSSCPGGCSGDDDDLGTPNEDFGGPGKGEGGEEGEDGENDEEQGNVLIISETLRDDDDDDRVDNPDDQKNTTVEFHFDFSDIGPVIAHGLTVIDVGDTEPTGSAELFDDNGDSIAEFDLPNTGDNGVAEVEWDGVEDVASMVVTLRGSGAIDDIRIEIQDCGVTTTTLGGTTTTSLGGTTTTSLGGTTTTSLGGTTTTSLGGTTTTSLGGTTTTSLGGTTTTSLGGTTTTTLGGTTTTLDGGTTTTVDGGTTTTLDGATTTTVDGGTTTTLDGATTTTVDGGTTTTLDGATTTTVDGATTTTVGGTTTTSLLETFRCGDADNSGSVTARDALLTLQSSVGLTFSCTLGVCDVDANSTVTAGDALRVLQYAVGISVDLNCG